jgi:branched-chain amino acid transport system ATP-binding protein
MNPLVQEITQILREINKEGVSVILVEQNAELALDLAHYAYVLETGRIALHGKGSELKDDEHVRKAYLGI